MRVTDKTPLPPHIENLLATATHDRLITQIRSLYHTWQMDVRDLERYGEAVYEATGATISGGLDPTDPGPDPVEFDLYQIRQMGDTVKALSERLTEATELLREARDDVVEASNRTHKPHAVAYYRDQLARIDAFLASSDSKGE